MIDIDNMSDYDSSIVSSTDDEFEYEEPITPWIDTLNHSDIIEIETCVYELMGDYLLMELENMSSPHFHYDMVKNITKMVFQQLIDINLCNNEKYYELEMFVEDLCNNFFETNENIPPRSYKKTFNSLQNDNETMELLTIKLEKIKNTYQPTQKTEEWYKYRHNMLTASNIWKVFASELQQNSLIYEKCRPFDSHHHENNNFTNVKSSLHWGNKYETLSIAIYEKIYKTKVEEFGCIVHDKYPFISASPDGINTDIKSGRYGRMVEVKNIVNREITGIPKEEYWIQMQIQMETCDLNECDFIETRFKEYEDEGEFYNEILSHEHNGVILYFVKKIVDFSNINNEPFYVYMPLNTPLNKESVDNWIQYTKEKYKGEYVLYEIQYWYLDEISCILVKRNKEWFQKSFSKIEQIWKTIEKERVDGYEHRNPKKKIIKPEVMHDENTTSQYIKNLPKNNHNICIIKLEE